MYQEFYHLTRNPFEMSPDPHFYFPTPLHNEALAILFYGVQMRKGFVVVTGEVGTGKTLLVRCLLDGLNRNNIAFAFVYNPVLSVNEFLTHVLTDFGISTGTRSKVDMLARLNNYLLERCSRGETTALVIDEAQLLSWELMEEIRLLTNLETTEHKLLQIVVAGQPELDRKLDSHGLRQLKQRVAMRCRLEALRKEDLPGYIQKRLELAGANSHAQLIFPEETIAAVYQFSSGIPRLINTICENALISGFSQQAQQVSPETIQEVARDLRLDQISNPPEPTKLELEEEPREEGNQVVERLMGVVEQWDNNLRPMSRKTERKSGTRTR
jgi:general secretion pathway protein A